MDNYWAIPAAYAFGLVVGHFMIGRTLSAMWKLLRLEADARGFDAPPSSVNNPFVRYEWQIAVVGLVERALYIASLQLGRPEFIAVWLTLKTVVHAREWSEDAFNPGRAVYNNFLAGNGLSILYSLMAAAIIQWTTGPVLGRSTLSAVLAPIALVLANLAMHLFLSRTRTRVRPVPPEGSGKPL